MASSKCKIKGDGTVKKYLKVAAAVAVIYSGYHYGWIERDAVSPVDRANSTTPANVVTGERTDGRANVSLPQGFITGKGVVYKLLSDDNEGSRHQRFLIRTMEGQSFLIVHNIDIAPRINSLLEGDEVEFVGEFIDNEKGGLVHWTHRDPDGRRQGGWLKVGGVKYE